MKFKIGDRVRAKAEFGEDKRCKGKTGTIVAKGEHFDWGVEFDERIDGGHDCGGSCKKGYGWFGYEAELEPVKESKFKVGDKVIGNEKAGREYCITTKGWSGEVVEINNDDIAVAKDGGNRYWVDPDCFDLYEEKPVKKSFKRESDYKVGDKVRIVRNNHFPMHSFSIGEVVEIKETGCGADTCFCEDAEGKTQYVHLSCFEPVKEEKGWRIEIVPDGEETTATLYKRGKAVKSATVKRYKGDEYSIADAADYAVQKLFEKKNKKEFKVGARVVGVGDFEGKNIDGCKGTIREIISSERFGVEFDKHIDGHKVGINGYKYNGHGWYCNKGYLKLL